MSLRTSSEAHRWGAAVLSGLVLAVAVGVVGGPAHADDVRAAQWHLDYLGVPRAHKTTQGEGVTVAVIDTGVHAGHRDLGGNVVAGADGFDPKGKGWRDPHDHGTQMAALVAAHGHGARGRDGVLGIAPKAKILPITVVGPGERGAGRTAVGDGIRYAADHGADIILVALSGPPGKGEKEAVAYAKQRHILVVAAAGNAQHGAPAVLGYPAGHEDVLAVAAIDRHGKFAKISASGFKIGLAAPGIDIMTASADGGYTKGSGTSHAAAVVAGLAALVKSKFPHEDETDLAVRLGGAARDAGPAGRDDQFGLGIPDVNRALALPEPPYASTSPSETSAAPSTAGTYPAAPPAPASAAGWLGGLLVALLVLAPFGLMATVMVLRRRAAATPLAPPAGEPAPPGQVNPGAEPAPPADVWKQPDRDAGH